MFFGNSKITLHRTKNCEKYGLTDKNFVVTISNGIQKDNIFIAYNKSCFQTNKWLNLATLLYDCTEDLFCETGLSAGANQLSTPTDCGQVYNGLSADVAIIENSFPQFGTQTIPSPFCTGSRLLPFQSQDCDCPTDFLQDESSQSFGGECYKSYDISKIGLNYSDEINPCRFVFAARAESPSIEGFPATVNIFYKTTVGGSETCNVVSLQIPPESCSPTYICWPPGNYYPEVYDPETGLLVDPCDLCVGSDVCIHENTVVANNNCKCPNEDQCFGSTSGSTSSSNCFFKPGMTTTQPCVNGSWNGETCVEGYNDVCGSTACVQRICKELDWFISNYGSSGPSFQGYSSFPIGFDDFYDDFCVACGQTTVSYFAGGDTGTTSFGDTTERRRWDRIVGLLHYFANEGIPTESGLGQTTVQFSDEYCRNFYPTQVCCSSVLRGSVDHSCPVCPITGFDESHQETVCCCTDRMLPIILAVSGLSGFAEAITGSVTIGLRPQDS